MAIHPEDVTATSRDNHEKNRTFSIPDSGTPQDSRKSIEAEEGKHHCRGIPKEV